MPPAQRARDFVGCKHAVVNWSDSAEAAIERMRSLDRECLAVTDAHGVLGLCERSVLLSIRQRGTWLGAVTVADVMRRGPFWCYEEDQPDKILATMDRLKTETLAVIDRRGRVHGTVHRQDLKADTGACP